MTIKANNILLFFISLAALLYCAMALPFSLPLEMIYPLELSGDWIQLLHISTNAAYTWRSDLVLGLLESGISLVYSGNQPVYFLLCLTSFYTGTLILFHVYLEGRHSLHALLNSLLLCLLLLFLFAYDITLFASLAWFPWLLLALSSAFRPGVSPSIFHYMLVVFFALRVAKSSNQFSFLLIVLAIFIAFVLGKAGQHTAYQKFTRANLTVAVLALLPALIVLYETPIPELPSYPQMSRVNSHDGTAGMARPLLASYAPIPIIDRGFLRETYGPISLLFLLSLLVLAPGLRNTAGHLPGLYLSGIGMTLLIVFDTLTPETISQISPLATLSRLIPGLHFVPLLPLLAAFFLFILFFILSQRKSVFLTSFVLLLLCTGLALLTPGALSANLGGFAFLQNKDKITRTHALSDHLGPNAEYQKILASPSLPIVKDAGPWIILEEDRLERTVFRNARPYTTHISASHGTGPRLLRRMTDDYRHRRWSERKGYQDGSEWLHFTFKEPMRLAGLEVSPGVFLADFPRGLQIAYRKTCEPDSLAEELVQGPEYSAKWDTYKVIAEYPHWQGSILFTKEGFPYYTGQHDVKVYFPKEITAQCILIRQTGKSRHFDWSVATLNLIVPR